MSTIIAGSRNFTDYKTLKSSLDAVEPLFIITEVVSGGARGADSLGERWALERSIPVVLFLPDWGTYGKTAGFIRNREMAIYADNLVAFWDGYSPGTRNMIDTAKRFGLKTKIVMV